MDIAVLLVIHIVAAGVAIAWALLRRDEVPLFIVVAVTYFGFYRSLTLTMGWSDWVDVSRLYGTAPLEEAQLWSALNLMTLGEAALIGAYIATFRQSPPMLTFSSSEKEFAFRSVNWILWMGCGVLAASWLLDRSVEDAVSDGAVLALGHGYFTHFSFIKIGVALLLAQLFLAGAARTPRQKIAFLVFFAVLIALTAKPDRRFEFLGWTLGALLLWAYGGSGTTYLRRVATGLLVGAVLIAAAGAVRNMHADDDLRGAALERISSARDANMLEGFALVLQAYPAIVPYRFGGGHLEILYRPIPRAIWPEKPLGGYALSSAMGGYNFEVLGTTGICPSLFGSFYEEGGSLAVIVFSLLYGVGLSRLVSWANRQGRLRGGLVKASVAAGLIPLLRGGDLAGITAWLAFSFIAVAVFVCLAARRVEIPIAAAGLRKST